MSDVAREKPAHAEPAADSTSSGPGRHRGPAAEAEEPQPKAPGPGRHRRTPGEG
ncbi:hypothetical protein [Streptomyces sp. RKND-216]|uniref:hypothetical protein n=1 Tax=Streptomyces sp. RKND-216 TaxID=2562581 RepID=UPI001444C154|nr:hypothetical protein [Streptomyces sp. RKND-216]